RDFHVTGVQTCALPIWTLSRRSKPPTGPIGNETLAWRITCPESGTIKPASRFMKIGVCSRAELKTAIASLDGICRRTEDRILRRSEERRVGKECKTERE